MEIILLKSHEKLGNIGDVINVKPGYARNYLIPNKIAQVATTSNIKALKSWIVTEEKKEAKNRENIELLAKYLNKLTIKFELQTGEDEKLFGSVTSQMISDAIAEKGYTVDKKEIEILEPIKSLGKSFILVKLGTDLVSKIKIKVVAE